jgi:prolyl-tRNA synthetase
MSDEKKTANVKKKAADTKSEKLPQKKQDKGGSSKDKSKKDEKSTEQQAMPKFSEDFGEWFNEILFQANILDYRYNLKGCGVWLAHGFKLRKNCLNIMRNLLDNTPIPHDEYLFPMLIPEPQFMKEAEHVKGFEEEVYWVKDGGTTPLDVKLALRPTSETVMYPMMALWIRSHQDLPLKTYQVVNTFRYEGKNTRPMIRVREITTFKEAHTCHASAEDAQNQIREAIGIYKAFFDAMAVPYIVSCRPRWDTFPGADYTIAFDCIFPGKHRTLQVGTVHNLGQTFGKTFNITFENKEGKQDLVYQTCYGISERAIAAVIATHGDDYGLLLPPNVTPIDLVIVPILFKEKEQIILDSARQLHAELKAAGLKVEIDTREISPGRKYYHWEIKGVPMRAELGPKDIEKGSVCLVRRDNRSKSFVPRGEIVGKVKELLSQIQADIWKAAKERHSSCVMRTKELDEALTHLEENKGVAEIPFCGDPDCAAAVEKRLESLKFLGIPEQYLDSLYDVIKPETEIYCVNCSKAVDKYWRIGRSY